MANLYCLVEVNDYSILQEPLKHTQRIKYTCFDISEHFIVLGSSSGSIYLFNESGKFLHLIPSGNGPVTKIQISAGEKYVAFAQRSKICVYAVNLSANATPQVIVSHLSTQDQSVQVTCLRWTQDEKQFFFGDTRGQVNLVILSSFIGHNILLNMTIHSILFLDTPIVQVDAYESLLLISTYSKCILCNTEYEEYKQIGSKPRDGQFGACFAISLDEASRPSRIYCARPGTRFWEADFEGDVLQTHQFKNALAIPPSKILKSRHNEDENVAKYEENDEMLDYAPQTLQFGKIQPCAYGFLLAYTELGLYIFDMSSKESVEQSTSRAILWSNQFERISDCKVFGDNIYAFTQTGSLCCVRLSTVQAYACSLVRSSRLLDCACLMRKHVKYFVDKSREDYGLNSLNNVKNFLINRQEYELLNDLSVIFDAIGQCEDGIDNNSSGGSSITAERYNNSISSTNSAPSNTNSNTSKSVYVLENAFCDNLNRTQKSNNDRHFKDALLTVTGKFGKNIIKYKFNIFAEEQQKLVQELIPTKERKMPFKEIRIQNENEDEIVCRNHHTKTSGGAGGGSSSQLAAANEANMHITAEEKTIYNLYLICKSSQIGNTKFLERYRALFDEYTVHELINIMTKLEKLMLEHGDEPCKAKKDCYEMYFNYLNPELLWEVDEETRDYISEGFIFLNSNNDMIRCENCEFPLRFDNCCLFYDLGAVLLRYYWSRNEQEKCFKVMTHVPALFDVLAKLYLVEGNIDKVLPMVLNYGQPELLRDVGKNFNLTAWIKCFELFKEYQFGRLICVNCDTIATVENVNRHFFYTWNCFLDIAIDYLRSEDILSLIFKWSSCIANDALDREFYIKCLLKS